MPQVDVIIPIFKTPLHFVQKTLESVKYQTFEDFHVLVVDDGSGISYQQELTEIISFLNDTRFELIIRENTGGAPVARNTAIRKSHSKYIAFLDSDDSWYLNKLEQQVTLMEENSYSLICGNMKSIDEKGEVIYERHPDPNPVYNTFNSKELVLSLLKKNWIKTLTVMVTRTSLEKVGLFDETLLSCQDWDLWIRYALIEKPIFLQDGTLGIYRHRENSISNNFDLVLQSRMNVLDKSIPLANDAFNGIISKELELTLRKNTLLSFASKYYHTGNFIKANELAKKSFNYEISLRGISRWVKSFVCACVNRRTKKLNN